MDTRVKPAYDGIVMTVSRIQRLTLTHFRNYRAASVDVHGDLVVLAGPNGAGKTNCMEAISFLSPGRGLRRATLDDVADNQGDGSWAVAAEIEGALGLATLGTGIEPPAPDDRDHDTALPDRSRAGLVGRGLRRPSAHGVADAGDGRPVPWRRLRAPPLPRSPRACHRQRPLRARQRAGTVAPLAQSPARRRARRRALAGGDRARDGAACGGCRCDAHRDGLTPAGGARRARRRQSHSPPQTSRSTAGWKSSS